MQTQLQRPNLWPEDFGTIDFVPPVAILREQATALGARTKNIVEAEVETTAEGGKFRHNFYVRATAAGDYRYLLLMVEQEIAPYPLRVFWSNEKTTECTSEADFTEALRDIFAEEHTRRVIQSLISYSTALPV
jgi:hypothetical protein